ncbi:protein phosphatase 2C domain-containing protein [Streptomyces sp. bgisy032]|uniref:protein phosphatase 2C domain-containing protein n=1 Tax=Streptomyces sp. bgisy032 TaxID=3413773 RepID=UPI003D7277B4
MLKILDSVTAAGDESRLNEDRYGFCERAAWVIDGATDLELDSYLPAPSDVQWLVDRVSTLLPSAVSNRDYQGARNLLRSLSKEIGEEMKQLGFPSDRIHPTCSIGLLLAGADGIELARIGDPTCLAFGHLEIELSTTFFGRREAQAIEQANGADLSDLNSRDGIRERRKRYIKGAFPESVFSGHPEAVLRIQVKSIQLDCARHILLCTDGFARAVVDYEIYPDWPTLLEVALESGLKSVLTKIRMYEADGKGAVHFKRSDDVTALLVEMQV